MDRAHTLHLKRFNLAMMPSLSVRQDVISAVRSVELISSVELFQFLFSFVPSPPQPAMSPRRSSSAAVPEHCYYCFEQINNHLRGSDDEEIEVAFDHEGVE